jgi:hypothetical protein
MKNKLTKGKFCKLFPEMKKIRNSDPIQFNVLFNDYSRKYKN